MTANDECRKVFEEDMGTPVIGLRKADFAVDSDGIYKNKLVAAAYDGWQACWNRHEQARKDAELLAEMQERDD